MSFQAPQAPPQNIAAEQAVLGAVMLIGKIPASVEDACLRPEHFYRESHGIAFATMQQMVVDGVEIDTVTLAERLQRDGTLPHVGGKAAVDLMAGAVPGIGAVADYAQTVVQKAMDRWRLQAAYSQIQAVHEQDEQAWQEAIVEAENAADGRRRSCDVDLADDFIKWYEGPSGLPTPFPVLTKAIGGGLVRGELGCCAAWPRWGKTILADQFVEVIAEDGGRCHIFVNEMNTAVRTARMLARANAAEWQRIRDKQLNAEEWGRVLRSLGGLPVQKYTRSFGWEVEEYVRAIRRNRWDFWVIDSGSRIPSRDTKDLERVSGMLADVAGETETYGMLVLQLNLERSKGLERPAPTARDLLGGGMWYRDCRNIFMIHRKQEIIGEEGEEQSVPVADGYVYDDKGTHAEPGAGRIAVKFNAKRMAFEYRGGGGSVHSIDRGVGMVGHDGERMAI